MRGAESHRVDYPTRTNGQHLIHDSDHDTETAAERRAADLRAGGWEAVAYAVTIHEQGSAA